MKNEISLKASISTLVVLISGCGTQPAPSQPLNPVAIQGSSQETAAFQRPKPFQNEYKCGSRDGIQIGGKCIQSATFKQACKSESGKIEWSTDKVMVCHTKRRIQDSVSYAYGDYHEFKLSLNVGKYSFYQSNTEALFVPGDQISFQKLNYDEVSFKTDNWGSKSNGTPNLYFTSIIENEGLKETRTFLELGPDTNIKAIPSKIWIKDSIENLEVKKTSVINPPESKDGKLSYTVEYQATVEHCTDPSGLSHYCD